MQTELIIIGSITYTMKAKGALSEAGVRANIRKLKAGGRGCSYGLEVLSAQLLTVAQVLRGIGIEYELYHP